jgi:hypothetical protein
MGLPPLHDGKASKILNSTSRALPQWNVNLCTRCKRKLFPLNGRLRLQRLE